MDEKSFQWFYVLGKKDDQEVMESLLELWTVACQWNYFG
jgi:hypothetical protein